MCNSLLENAKLICGSSARLRSVTTAHLAKAAHFFSCYGARPSWCHARRLWALWTLHRLGRSLGHHTPQLQGRMWVVRATTLSINREWCDTDADGTATQYYNHFGKWAKPRTILISDGFMPVVQPKCCRYSKQTEELSDKRQWVQCGSVCNDYFLPRTSHLVIFVQNAVLKTVCVITFGVDISTFIIISHPCFVNNCVPAWTGKLLSSAIARQPFLSKVTFTDHTRHKNISVWPSLQKNKNTARSLASASWSSILVCSSSHSNFPPEQCGYRCNVYCRISHNYYNI